MEKNSLKDIKSSLNDTKWFLFLDSLYSKLSDYEIQEDTSKFNVASLENLGKHGYTQGIKINETNIEQFMNVTAKHFNLDLINISHTKFDVQHFVELNTILNSTLRQETQISCSEAQKVIQGSYISIKSLKNDTLVDDSCIKRKYKDQEKGILIFASNTIFIDEDIVVKGDSLAILSPKWVIIGNRTIDLSGNTGDSQVSLLESKGRSGKPGRPGELGGSFFGIGDTFVNGRNLTILANGGTGGNGEDGKTGISGTDGRTPEVPWGMSCLDNLCDGDKKINGFSCQKDECKRMDISGIRYGIISYYNVCLYRVKGELGHKGGNGGDGGRGGIGGNPGNITLYELSDQSEILRYDEKGLDGKNGTGGAAGSNGKNGDDIFVKCVSGFRNNWRLESTLSNLDLEKGINGTDGANARNMETPKLVRADLGLIGIVLRYKRFMRERLLSTYPGDVGYDNVFKFMEKLNNDQKIKSNYKTVDFINELKSLEELHLEFKKHPAFLSSYESLLERLDEYSQNRTDTENSDEIIKIIGFLYTNTLTTTNNLKHLGGSETSLITNVGRYLNFLKQDIVELKNLQRVKNKADIVNSYKQKYKENVDKNILDAKNLIDKVITPEVDFISTKMDDNINSLIDEVKALKKASIDEKNDLVEKKQELEDAAKLRILFGSVKVISSLVSFLGPIGATIGMISGTASTAVESVILSNGNNLQGPMLLHNNIFSDTEMIRDRVNSLKLDKINQLNRLLENLSEQVKVYPDDFGTLSGKISDIKTRLAKIDQNNFSFEAYKNLKKELMEELKHEKDRLEYQEVLKNSKNKRKPIEAIRVLELNSVLSSDMLSVYDKFRYDQLAVDEVTGTIEQNYDDFAKLEEYEEMIHKAIVPMLQNVNGDLSNMQSKLDTKSAVSLEVTKWQVQSILKSLDLQIQQLGDGLKIKNELLTCIQNLYDAMGILINVYVQIQNYRNEQSLINFVADVTYNSLNTIYVEDPELLQALNDLELKLKSNLILQQYERAFGAFKQLVFPFAHTFLKNLMLPSHLRLQKNIDNLTYNAVTQIDNIVRMLRNYNDFVSENEVHGTSDFNSRGTSTRPFYVWKNEENRSRIRSLLSGRGEIFISDVQKSATDKDAVKFNDLFLDFKAKNGTRQSEVDTLLEGFKITFTHLGVSHYRFKSQFYVIGTKKLEFWYSFEKNKNGEPVHKGGAYDSIKNADYMLSPYGYWLLKLSRMENNRNITFEDLKEYESEVDLELGGHARYVIEDKVGLDLKVSDYYQLVENYEFQEMDVAKMFVTDRGRLKRENFSHVIKEKKNGWFSWLDFNVLPGADGATLETSEKSKLNYETEPNNGRSSVSTVLDDLVTYVDSFKRTVSSTFLNPLTSTFHDVVSNFSERTMFRGNVVQSIGGFSTDASSNFYPQPGTLLLTWLLLGKRFSHGCQRYVSPEEEKNTKINELSATISSILRDQGIIQSYDGVTCQWYRDLFRDEEFVTKPPEL